MIPDSFFTASIDARRRSRGFAPMLSVCLCHATRKLDERAKKAGDSSGEKVRGKESEISVKHAGHRLAFLVSLSDELDFADS